MTNMKTSQAGRQFLRDVEGCRLNAYLDTGGVWTIGVGHTKDVFPGMSCTAEQADDWLSKDILWAENAVNKLVKVNLSQHQFDALVSFTFNLGASAFQGSTLLRLLNSGDYQGAKDQFKRWDKDNGVSVKGLAMRRGKEAEMFQRKVLAGNSTRC